MSYELCAVLVLLNTSEFSTMSCNISNIETEEYFIQGYVTLWMDRHLALNSTISTSLARHDTTHFQLSMRRKIAMTHTTTATFVSHPEGASSFSSPLLFDRFGFERSASKSGYERGGPPALPSYLLHVTRP